MNIEHRTSNVERRTSNTEHRTSETRERVLIFDTTLRDGEQSPGCTMTPADKLRLAKQLERLGVDVLEAGFPIASPAEWEAVHVIAQEVRDCSVAALCRARETDIDAAVRALQGAGRPRVHVFLSTSAIHLEHKLRIGPEEALRQLEAGVRLARSTYPDVEFSPEDASRTDYAFLCEAVQTAYAAGASTINIPDTVGYALPDEFSEIIRQLKQDVPGPTYSVHCHNDLGLAVANSLAGVRAGARQVEATINGIGERAGNTSLEEFVMALKVREAVLGLTTEIRTEEIGKTSRMLSSITGMWPQPNKAIVGKNAFAHEAGIHQHGVLSNPLTYEIMTPASVGMGDTHLVLGKHCGWHAVQARCRALGLELSREELDDLTARIKALADEQRVVGDEDLLALAGQRVQRAQKAQRARKGQQPQWS